LDKYKQRYLKGFIKTKQSLEDLVERSNPLRVNYYKTYNATEYTRETIKAIKKALRQMEAKMKKETDDKKLLLLNVIRAFQLSPDDKYTVNRLNSFMIGNDGSKINIPTPQSGGAGDDKIIPDYLQTLRDWLRGYMLTDDYTKLTAYISNPSDVHLEELKNLSPSYREQKIQDFQAMALSIQDAMTLIVANIDKTFEKIQMTEPKAETIESEIVKVMQILVDKLKGTLQIAKESKEQSLELHIKESIDNLVAQLTTLIKKIEPVAGLTTDTTADTVLSQDIMKTMGLLTNTLNDILGVIQKVSEEADINTDIKDTLQQLTVHLNAAVQNIVDNNFKDLVVNVQAGIDLLKTTEISETLSNFANQLDKLLQSTLVGSVEFLVHLDIAKVLERLYEYISKIDKSEADKADNEKELKQILEKVKKTALEPFDATKISEILGTQTEAIEKLSALLTIIQDKLFNIEIVLPYAIGAAEKAATIAVVAAAAAGEALKAVKNTELENIELINAAQRAAAAVSVEITNEYKVESKIAKVDAARDAAIKATKDLLIGIAHVMGADDEKRAITEAFNNEIAKQGEEVDANNIEVHIDELLEAKENTILALEKGIDAVKQATTKATEGATAAASAAAARAEEEAAARAEEEAAAKARAEEEAAARARAEEEAARARAEEEAVAAARAEEEARAKTAPPPGLTAIDNPLFVVSEEKDEINKIIQKFKAVYRERISATKYNELHEIIEYVNINVSNPINKQAVILSFINANIIESHKTIDKNYYILTSPEGNASFIGTMETYSNKPTLSLITIYREIVKSIKEKYNNNEQQIANNITTAFGNEIIFHTTEGTYKLEEYNTNIQKLATIFGINLESLIGNKLTWMDIICKIEDTKPYYYKILNLSSSSTIKYRNDTIKKYLASNNLERLFGIQDTSLPSQPGRRGGNILTDDLYSMDGGAPITTPTGQALTPEKLKEMKEKISIFAKSINGLKENVKNIQSKFESYEATVQIKSFEEINLDETELKVLNTFFSTIYPKIEAYSNIKNNRGEEKDYQTLGYPQLYIKEYNSESIQTFKNYIESSSLFRTRTQTSSPENLMASAASAAAASAATGNTTEATINALKESIKMFLKNKINNDINTFTKKDPKTLITILNKLPGNKENYISDIKTFTDYPEKIISKYGEFQTRGTKYTNDEYIALTDYFKKNGDVLKKDITAEAEKIKATLQQNYNDIFTLLKPFESKQWFKDFKQNLLNLLENNKPDTPAITNTINIIVRDIVQDIDTLSSRIQQKAQIAEKMTKEELERAKLEQKKREYEAQKGFEVERAQAEREKAQAEREKLAAVKAEVEREKLAAAKAEAERKSEAAGGGMKYGGVIPEETTKTVDKKSRETIKNSFEAINKNIDSVVKEFTNVEKKITNISDPATSLALSGDRSIFNALYDKYLESKQRGDVGGDMRATEELMESLEANQLVPRTVLAINMRDKIIFIFATLFIRLFSLSVIEFMIEKGAIKNSNFAILGYLGLFTLVFIAFTLLVNLDMYRLRIVFNYINFHANAANVYTYLALLWVFGGVIYYITYYLNKDAPLLNTTDETKVRLIYRIQVISLIIWLFLVLMVSIL